MLLQVEDVHVKYGHGHHAVHAVRGVSLEVAPGEILGLVGESGCGKSTLGRAILGLEKIADGSVRFDGQNVTNLRGEALKIFRQQAQMVFQDPFGSLNPRIPVGAAIEEVLCVHRIGKNRHERRERVRQLFKDVELDPRMVDRYPHEFSGGQRQRIGIARALALGPKLLIADEPVSALDVSVQASILALVKKLQRQHNLAYLFVSHDLAVVRNISDRIAVMNEGVIVETGTAEEVIDRAQHEYTQKLLSAVPEI
ncbi:ATP-binding cassette domain-containing protein [Verrucomicrobiota bacterium]